MTVSTSSHPIDLQDRLAITDVIVSYGTAIDKRDWNLFEGIFTEDADIEYGFGSWNSAASFRATMQGGHDPLGKTLHRMTNVVITRTENGLAARTYGDSIVLAPDEKTGDHAAAYYDDDLVLQDGRWRISRRVCTLVLFEKISENAAAGM